MQRKRVEHRRLQLALLVVASWVVPAVFAAAPAGPRFSVETAKAIENAIQEQINGGKTPGVAIQVTQDGKIALSAGYGKANLEWDTAVTPDTVFRIASNTKTMTAACILLLVERGKLTLDDKLSRFLPGFPRADEVTIRNLLTHTAGIVDYPGAYIRKEEWVMQKSTQEMIDIIAGLRPTYLFSPGTAYSYSNSGYYLLGYIIEKISGLSLGTFMDENLFSKTGMSRTAMDRAEDVVPYRAGGYDSAPGQPGKYRNALYTPYTFPGPAGGLRSTVGDLCKWHVALFGGHVVAPQLLALMTTPAKTAAGLTTSQAAVNARASDKVDYGFGIRVGNLRGHRFFQHSGNIAGFASYIQTFPDDKITIALLANTGDGLSGLGDKVVEAIMGKAQ